ncbi:hypothetical protein [Bradyrhizobium barranii]
MATVMATMAALILKELKSIIELSSEAGRMPATMPAGTIEGAAQCLKQLLASPRRQLAVVNPSHNSAKDFLKTDPSAEESFRRQSPYISSFAK